MSLVCPVTGLGVIGWVEDPIDERELEREDRERGGGVVSEKPMAFFGVVTSRGIDDNKLEGASCACERVEAGVGENGEPRTGKFGSSETRQARLFFRSSGGGRLEASANAVEGLNSSREGEIREPKESSLDAGDTGLDDTFRQLEFRIIEAVAHSPLCSRSSRR